MRTIIPLRGWLVGSVLLICLQLNAQNPFVVPAAYHINGDGSTVSSNVPLNEINIHAFRHFQKRFPSVSGEFWTKTEDGYIVSFTDKGLHCQAHFDPRGGFMYWLKYYAGKDIDKYMGAMILHKYPGYFIKVVTEITDGDKVFYLVGIENGTSAKTISVCDGSQDIAEIPVVAGR